jgi:hypothetical protein
MSRKTMGQVLMAMVAVFAANRVRFINQLTGNA